MTTSKPEKEWGDPVAMSMWEESLLLQHVTHSVTQCESE